MNNPHKQTPTTTTSSSSSASSSTTTTTTAHAQEHQQMPKLTQTKYQRKRKPTKQQQKQLQQQQQQQQAIIQHTSQLYQQQQAAFNYVGLNHSIGGFATNTSAGEAGGSSTLITMDYDLTHQQQQQQQHDQQQQMSQNVHTFHVERLIDHKKNNNKHSIVASTTTMTTTTTTTTNNNNSSSNQNQGFVRNDCTKDDELLMYNNNNNNRQQNATTNSLSQQKQRRSHTIATIMSHTCGTHENPELPLNFSNVRNINYTPMVGTSGTTLPANNLTTAIAAHMEVQSVKGKGRQSVLPRTSSPSSSTSSYPTYRQRQPQQQQAPQLVTITPPPRDIASPQHIQFQAQQSQQSIPPAQSLAPPQTPSAQESTTNVKYNNVTPRMLWRPPLIWSKQNDTNTTPPPMLQLMLPPRSIPGPGNFDVSSTSTITTSAVTIGHNNSQSLKRSYNRKTNNTNTFIQPTITNSNMQPPPQHQSLNNIVNVGGNTSSSATISDGATPPQSLRSFLHTQHLQQQQQQQQQHLHIETISSHKMKGKFPKHYNTTTNTDNADTLLPNVSSMQATLNFYQHQKQQPVQQLPQPITRKTITASTSSQNKSRNNNNNKYLYAAQQLAASLPPGTQLHHRSMPTLSTTANVQNGGNNSIHTIPKISMSEAEATTSTLLNHSVSSIELREVGVMQPPSSTVSMHHHTSLPQKYVTSVTSASSIITSSASSCVATSTIKFVNSSGTVIQQMPNVPPAVTKVQQNRNLEIASTSAMHSHVQSTEDFNNIVNHEVNNVNDTYVSPITQTLHERSHNKTRALTSVETTLMGEDVMIVNGTQMTDELSARILQSMAQNSFSNRYQQQQHQHQNQEQITHLQTLAANNCSISCSKSNGSYEILPLTTKEYANIQQVSISQSKYLPTSNLDSNNTIVPVHNRSATHSAPVSRAHSLERQSTASILTATAKATVSSSTAAMPHHQVDKKEEFYHDGYVFV